MPTILREQIDLSEAVVDIDARVLRNVILIREGRSLNKRRYTEDVLRAAASIFEGVAAYDSHDRRARKVGETTGWYENSRYDDTKRALYADRHFSDTQAGRDVWAIANPIASGRAPKTLAGLSINASGKGKMQKTDDGEEFVVESITSAESVDDVGTPAAGGAYREADNGDALAIALLEAMEYTEFLEARPDFVERLRKELKAARQDEALTAAKAEADQRVKDAEQMLEQAQAALQEAQDANETLITEREAAVTEAQTARRDLAIEQVLNDPKVKLPAAWRTDLREKLQTADPPTWVSLIEGYQRLATSAGQKPRVGVSGAGQQVSDSVPAPEQRIDPIVRARQRLAEATSPEELQRIQATLER